MSDEGIPSLSPAAVNSQPEAGAGTGERHGLASGDLLDWSGETERIELRIGETSIGEMAQAAFGADDDVFFADQPTWQ